MQKKMSFLKLPFSLIGILLFLHISYAQEKRIEVNIFLENGSSLEGYILEKIFDEWLRFEKKKSPSLFERENFQFKFWYSAIGSGYFYIAANQVGSLEKVFKPLEKKEDEILRQKVKALQNKKNGKTKNPKDTVPKKKKTESWFEIDPETQKQYQEILKKYPLGNYELQSVLRKIKLRIRYGMPFVEKEKEFLVQFPLWHKALLYQKKQVPLSKIKNEKKLTEAKKIVAQFPMKAKMLEKEVEKMRLQSRYKIPINPQISQWLSHLDLWVEARMILKKAK